MALGDLCSRAQRSNEEGGLVSIQPKRDVAVSSETEALARLNAELLSHNLEGHWKLANVIKPEPTAWGEPYLWRWLDIRRLLWRAGEMRGIEGGATRRTVRLCTPGLGAKWATPTIHASVQLVKPGEIADAHRHSMGAFRYVLEGKGGYTTVDGQKIEMVPGDLVLTPSLSWHDHGHDGGTPTIWIDVHDFPFVNYLGGLFFEGFASRMQAVNEPSGALSSYVYRAADMQAALLAAELDKADPALGITIKYESRVGHPDTLPTMGCRLHKLGGSNALAAVRQTANVIYHAVAGTGVTQVGNQTFRWQAGDILVMPSWTWHHHAELSDDAVLFSVSDEPILNAFGLMRREYAPRKN